MKAAREGGDVNLLTPEQVARRAEVADDQWSGQSCLAATLREYAAIVEGVATGRTSSSDSDTAECVYCEYPYGNHEPDCLRLRARKARGYET